MANSFSRILIENMVRKALKEINDSPGRGARNLVDMALHFSKGRFQKHFFEIAQNILHNESSSYYPLIQDVTTHVDHDRILKFGINLGYNSCTLGAKKIREIENKEEFNIPWSISLEMDPDILVHSPELYASIIEQGMELGIGTWFLFVTGILEHVIYLAEQYSDCAFIFFCSPEDITEEVIEKTTHIHNIMFSIDYQDEERTAWTCRLLRMNEYPYCLHYQYDSASLEDILDDEIIVCMKNYHPVFCYFIPDSFCDAEIRNQVYEYVRHVRNSQLYPVIPLDLYNDNITIDSIISEDACTAGFNKEGFLSRYIDQTTFKESSLFDTPLKKILKTAFPK